jgi:hypothetical protein
MEYGLITACYGASGMLRWGMVYVEAGSMHKPAGVALFLVVRHI